MYLPLMELKVNDPAGVEKTIATVKSTKFEMNGVPFKLPVYADDAARDAAIPAPEVGMIVFMLNGTSPSATNKAQVSTVASVGGWVNLH
jgi:hypothetical protein